MAPAAADLRAELARRRIPIYVLAARIEVHPTRLGSFLNERLPMSAEFAGRVAAAIQGLDVERRGR